MGQPDSRIAFMVPGIPCAWARARLSGKRHFTPKKQAGAMALVQVVAAEAMAEHDPFTGPVRMSVNAVWPWPKSRSEKKRREPGAHHKTSKPDSDNVGKLVSDAINGVVFVDDAQVAELRVTKQYGMGGATYVTVEALA